MTEQRVYLRVAELEECEDVHLWRRGCRTLLTVDPWADRFEALRAMTQRLTEYELDCVLEAFGWPDGVVPLAWLTEVGPMAVPESLWLSALVDD